MDQRREVFGTISCARGFSDAMALKKTLDKCIILLDGRLFLIGMQLSVHDAYSSLSSIHSVYTHKVEIEIEIDRERGRNPYCTVPSMQRIARC